MGIKDFTHVFKNQGAITFKHLKNNTIAIDASIELYRTSLGMSSIRALTDHDGKSTVHINTLLANIIKYQQNHIKQIWVFDYESQPNEQFHNPLKMGELQKRKKAKDKAIAELRERKTKDELDEGDLFSDDENVEINDEVKVQTSVESLEKRSFSLSKDAVNDLKFILNCFDIMWLESPFGYESEQVCAALTNIDLENPNDHKNMHLTTQIAEKLKADYVWSQDADTLMFGAKALIRKNMKPGMKKTADYYVYYLDKVLEGISNEATIDDLIKIGVILGCDFAKKTPKIGAKTVLKKYKNVELTEEQKNAVKFFKTRSPDMSEIVIWNHDKTPFSDAKKAGILVTWLESKAFSKARVQNQIAKVITIAD